LVLVRTAEGEQDPREGTCRVKPHYSDESVTLHHGDALEVLRGLADSSVDSVCTDPPYSLGFMGREWDSHDGPEDAAFAYWLTGFVDGEGCFRVQRHERGSYTCTFAIKVRRDERGTLERVQRALGGIGTIRDGEGSGNAHPQSTYAVQDKAGCLRLVRLFDKYPLRAKKRLDYEPWAEAVVEWNSMRRGHRWSGRADWSRMAALKSRVEAAREYVDPPWSGHGYQDWCRLWARECLRVLKPGGHLLAFGGTRTYHRLACAVEDAGFEIRDSISWLYGSGFPKNAFVLKPGHEPIVVARRPLAGTVDANLARHGTGILNVDACRIDGDRWPSNAVLDVDTADQLDRETGVLTSGANPTRRGSDKFRDTYGKFAGQADCTPARGAESGGASRFFPVFRYEAKAPTSERPRVDGEGHETVKPLDLMRWLVRLVTPAGGLVLDPFAGSGTTAEACVIEGFRCITVERKAKYLPLIVARLSKPIQPTLEIA
jgi:DNA modification methylase